MHDAFLSYSRHDRATADRLRTRLGDAGVETFLDRTRLTPGKPWQPELECALTECRAVIVLIGARGLGNWQQREAQAALDLQTRTATLLVIPVLLGGAEEPPLFLGLNTWIDLEDPAGESAEIDRLVRALRPEAAAAAPPRARPAICPYRALKAFREEDARFFYGRDDAVDELEQKVDHLPVVAVVGASGSGKSSVARAGLASRLRKARGDTWQIVTLTPTDRPLRALAAAFVPLLDGGGGEASELAATRTIEESLRDDPGALRDLAERALKNEPGTTRLLLVADQWEELYTLSHDRDLRDRFIAQVLDAARSPAFRCVLTVRGDYWGHVLQSRPLAAQLRDAMVNLAPMSVEALRRAIVEPAKAVGLDFEDGLVDRILEDVGDEPGNLPLLEFLLYQLWQLDHDDGTLSHGPYVALGGVKGAIAHRANEILARKNETEQAQVRRVFGRLVRPGAGASDTRRRAVSSEFADDDVSLIRELVDARLLVISQDASGPQTASADGDGPVAIEIAHEALIREWPELRRWIDEDREFLSWRNRLHLAQAEFERTQADSDLLTGPRLAEARRWLDERESDLAADERAFVDRSAARVRRARRWRVASVGSVFAMLAGALGVVLWFWSDSVTAREDLEQTRKDEQRTTDPLLVERLIRNAQAPWPRADSARANLDWIDGWIREADGVLERRDGHRAFAATNPETTAGIELQAMLDRLGETGDLTALRADIESRRGLFTAARWDGVWTACEGDLRDRVEAFGDVSGLRRTGLVPLGRDLERTTRWPPGATETERRDIGRDVGPLWLFAVGGTGSIPTWDGELGGDGRAVLEDDTAILLVLVPATRGLPAFLIAKTELTNAQCGRFLATGYRAHDPPPDPGSNSSRLPAVGVSFNDAAAFGEWSGLRTPREAEWEYACRAGTTANYWSGEEPADLALVAWYDQNSDGRRRAVAEKLPNTWGLFDMHGNAGEWTFDPRHKYGFRPVRGGSWKQDAAYAGGRYDQMHDPSIRFDTIGFRPARSVTE